MHSRNDHAARLDLPVNSTTFALTITGDSSAPGATKMGIVQDDILEKFSSDEGVKSLARNAPRFCGLDGWGHDVQQSRMKVARKSPKNRPRATTRATLTLSLEVYRKIDLLRGAEARSVWVQRLVEREERQRERERLAETLREQYTNEVCRETLSINDESPVHEQ